MLVRPKRSAVQLSLGEASPMSGSGSGQPGEAGAPGGSFDDLLCCVGRAQQFADRVVRLSARQLKDCRADEDVLFMPGPDKCHFFLRRSLAFRAGILKPEPELGLQPRRLGAPTRAALAADPRLQALAGPRLAPPPPETSAGASLQGRLPLDRRNLHFASGQSLSRQGSPFLAASYKRKQSVSADATILGAGSAELSCALPAIKQTRTGSRLRAGTSAKPLQKALLRR